MTAKILVTPRSLTVGGHRAFNRLTESGFEVVFCTAGRQPAAAELKALLPGCVGYLAGVEPVTADVIDAADVLKVISRNGTGIDNVDLEAARRRGICVCRAEGANARGVAELTIGLMLALTRSIPFSDRAVKTGDWQRRKGVELQEKTLGLIGCGRIGKLVAEMAIGLGMKIIAFDVFADTSFRPSAQFRFGTIDEVYAESDVISLHCPPQPNGRPLIDAGELACMKRGVYLINAARYDLIDAAAVATALDSGQVAGLALDVFDHEPPVNNPLAGNDRVIATPHVGGLTEESVDRAVFAAVDNLLAHLATNGKATSCNK